MTEISDLSGLLIVMILLKLNPKMRVVCRLVCKNWQELCLSPLIPNPYNRNMSHFLHYERSRSTLRWLSSDNLHNPYMVLDLTRTPVLMRKNLIMGPSVNGLTMLKNNEVYGGIGGGLIINPITLEFFMLPGPQIDNQYKVFFGFGIDETTSIFKVIRISQRDFEDERDLLLSPGNVTADLYCLGTGGWRSVVVHPFIFEHQSFGLFHNGRCHFLTVGDSMCAFDCLTDRFLDFPSTPAGISEKRVRNGVCLCVVNGNLCQIFCTVDKVSIWKMSDYGIGNSWERYLCLDRMPCEEPFEVIDRFDIFSSTPSRFLIRRDYATFTIYAPVYQFTLSSTDYYLCGGKWDAKSFTPTPIQLRDLEPSRAQRLIL